VAPVVANAVAQARPAIPAPITAMRGEGFIVQSEAQTSDVQPGPRFDEPGQCMRVLDKKYH
jgi:hypothetical protein